MTKNLSANITNLIILMVGVALLASTRHIQAGGVATFGANFMPKLMTGSWVLFAAILFIKGLFDSYTGSSKPNIKKLLATIALLFLYVYALRPIGFIIASVIYCFFQMLIYTTPEMRTKRSFVTFAIVSLVSPIIINLLFVNVFFLILPEGDLVRMLF